MADNLRLRVVLDLVDRVLSPLKRISAGGTETARALKAAKDQLKQLNAQQAAVTNVQTQAAEFQRLNNQLKQRQALLDGMRARGDATRTAMAREENAVAKLTAALKQQREAAGEARRKLNEMGITGNLSAAQARLKTDIDGATAAMAKQRAELAKMGEQQRKLAELRKKHGSEMMHVGMMAAGSAALMAGGNKMAGPLRPEQVRHCTDNREEMQRARHAFELAASGRRAVVVSSGDPGVFAMAAAVRFHAGCAGEDGLSWPLRSPRCMGSW